MIIIYVTIIMIDLGCYKGAASTFIALQFYVGPYHILIIYLCYYSILTYLFCVEVDDR